MPKTFPDKYFSAAKIVKFRRKIHNFCQKDTETVFEAWKRFKEIVRRCQHSGIEPWMQLQDFWDGLTPSSRRTLSTAVGGPLIKKTPEEIVAILDELYEDANQWLTESNDRRKAVGINQDSIAKQKDELIEGNVEIVEEQKNSNNQEGEVRVDGGLKKKKGNTRAQKKKNDGNSMNEETEEIKYMPALPFLQKQRREKLDKQFRHFLEVLKQVHVNLPFIEVLSQIPVYAKFLKEILSNKRKLEETSDVKLTEHCSAILQNKLPQKYGDPGSFTISYSLGSTKFEKSLYDSGASINLMPLSIFKKLEGEIGEIRSIPVSLQVEDQITIIPEGIMEDVLVRVDKFVFHMDFIMVNMEDKREVSLILERPFLATGRAILDIQERQLMLRVGEEIVIFKMKGAMGAPRDELTAHSKFKARALKE
ncbi:uncharacterized protein [Nicotiana tomentosiformis]|uniref:uncharacterized protein n=1 Tax=Nicotiana tomentosiformis TaxID=4098 RepID=UPI00388C4C13